MACLFWGNGLQGGSWGGFVPGVIRHVDIRHAVCSWSEGWVGLGEKMACDAWAFGGEMGFVVVMLLVHRLDEI